MRWAVEARIFDNGRIVAKVRLAEEGETNHMEETRTCDVWVDVFGSETEARQFCRDYKRA